MPAPQSLTDLLCQAAARHPQAHGFGRWGDSGVEAWIDFGSLDRRARGLAARMQAAIAPGARVLLLAPPGFDYIAAFYACSYAGVIAVPAYPPEPSRLERMLPRLRAIAADAGAGAVAAPRALIAAMEPLVRLLPGLGALAWIAVDDAAADDAAADSWRDPGVNPDDVALLQYTSGSTGEPKGVIVTHGNLLHNCEGIRRAHGYDRSSRMVTWLPPYHDMGLVGSIVQPVYTGFACLQMSPVQFLLKPLRWLQAITAFGGTSSGAPNFAYELCVQKISEQERAQLDLSSWRLAYCGAEPVRRDTLDRFAATFASCGFRSAAFSPCYGLAEATLMVSGVYVGSESEPSPALAPALHASAGPDGPVLSMGTPVHENEIIVVAPDSRSRLDDGVVGEIWVRSIGVARGYWGRPAETAAVFGARTADGDGPYLRTGDLGFLRGAELHITGRLKELIVVRGRKLAPNDVEATIDETFGGAHYFRAGGSAAFAAALKGEERLVVAVELERRRSERRTGAAPASERRHGADRRRRPFRYRTIPPIETAPDQIAVRLHASIAAAHGVEPFAIVFLRPGALPKTSSGKKQRLLLRDQLLNGAMEDVLHTWRRDGQRAKTLRGVA